MILSVQSVKIVIHQKKEEKMIATALKIQEATGDAVTDFSTMSRASQLLNERNNMTEEEFISAIWDYSAHLSALTATLVTSVCLTKDQMDSMVDTIREFDELGKEFN